MKNYALSFAVVYLLLSILLFAIAEAFDLKGGAGLGIAATLASSFLLHGNLQTTRNAHQLLKKLSPLHG